MGNARSVWRVATARRLPHAWFALFLTLGACGLGGPAHEASVSDAAVIVEMTNGHDFDPRDVAVPAGSIIEWRNISFFTHTVTADPARAGDPGHVALPPGAAPFDSGEIPAGEIFRRRFTVPGTYRYFCIPHEGMGMIGTITVAPAT